MVAARSLREWYHSGSPGQLVHGRHAGIGGCRTAGRRRDRLGTRAWAVQRTRSGMRLGGIAGASGSVRSPPSEPGTPREASPPRSARRPPFTRPCHRVSPLSAPGSPSDLPRHTCVRPWTVLHAIDDVEDVKDAMQIDVPAPRSQARAPARRSPRRHLGNRCR